MRYLVVLISVLFIGCVSNNSATKSYANRHIASAEAKKLRKQSQSLFKILQKLETKPNIDKDLLLALKAIVKYQQMLLDQQYNQLQLSIQSSQSREILNKKIDALYKAQKALSKQVEALYKLVNYRNKQAMI